MLYGGRCDGWLISMSATEHRFEHVEWVPDLGTVRYVYVDSGDGAMRLDPDA